MGTTGKTIEIGGAKLQEHKDTLSFTVPPKEKIKPEQANRAGEKYEKEFIFPQVADDVEADAVCTEKEWSLVDFVNDALKNAARSSAYQSELTLYKLSEVSREDVVERMVRDFIRVGKTEVQARAIVKAALGL